MPTHTVWAVRPRYKYYRKKFNKTRSRAIQLCSVISPAGLAYHLPGWLSLSCRRCAVVAVVVILGRALLPRGVGPTPPPRVGFVVDPSPSLSSSSSLLLACRGWFQFAVVGFVGFDSLWVVSIRCRCHSFRFAAVGLESASLVSSRPSWFLHRLAPLSPCRLASPLSCRLAPPSPSRLALPLLLVIVLFPFLLVVLSSRLRRCVVSHPRHPSPGRPSSLLLRGLVWS